MSKDEGRKALDGVRGKIKEKLRRDDARVVVSMHRPEKEQERKEGEQWTDADGKLWQFKNGHKEKVDSMKGARTPWWCPQCGKSLHQRNDDKMYRKTGKCFDCVLKEETKIRLAGKWELYERIKVRANMLSHLRDQIVELEGYINTITQPSFVLASGEIQRWNVDIDTVKADLQKNLDTFKQYQIQLTKEQADDESKYNTDTSNNNS